MTARRLTLRRSTLVLALLALLFCATGARAQDLYTVTGIAEDQVGASAQAARETAQLDSQRKAFRQLVERLSLPDGGSALVGLGDREIAALVDSFQVDDERISAVRYLGVFTYRFRAGAIQSLIQARAGANGTAGQLVVEVPLGSLEAWLAVRQRMGDVPRVAKTTVVSLKRDRAILALDISGDPQALIPLMAGRDMRLAQEGDRWILTPLRVPTAASPPPPPPQ